MRTFLGLMIAIWSLSMACYAQDTQGFPTDADEARARQYIDYLRHGQFDEIEAVADATIQSPQIHDVLTRMRALIPAKDPVAVKRVGAQRSQGPNGVSKNLTYEYDFGGQWLMINVATHEKEGAFTIYGFNVYPRVQSLEMENRFELAGKTPFNYVMLALTVALPLFTLVVLVICIRTKLSGRKWPWILFILIGIGKLTINWNTGAWDFKPLAVQLFSASAFSLINGPWFFGVSLPLGALIFLFRRRALRARALDETYD